MKIKFWENSNGKCYVGDFIKSQSPEETEKILQKMEFMEEFGKDFTLKLKNFKKLNISVVTIYQVTVSRYRFLGTIIKGDLVLVDGFKKKSSQTPKREIKKSINRIKRIF
jgi:phage-related protein